MAEEALKKLEEQLNCSICLDTYTDPKLLQCFHVYCRKCLVPLVDRDQQGKLGIPCPTCRQITPIPDIGVSGLKSAFHINHLLELQKSFQKVENAADTLQSSGVNPIRKARDCFDHEGRELELYCETCGELICYKCVIKDGKHDRHDYLGLDQACEKYKKEIASSLEPMEKQVMTIKKALAQLDACCEEISDQQTATAGNIHVTFTQLREVLNVREAELIHQLQQVTKEKMKGLAAQRNQIEATLAQLCSCLHIMEESLRPGNEEDVLKSDTINRVRDLSTPFPPDVLEPSTKADTVFSAFADLTALCQNYGHIFYPGLSDPSSCHLSADLEVGLVGDRSIAVLQAINFEGKPCKEPINVLECELVSEITGRRDSCSVERRGQSQYKISYQPTIKGRHQLHIKAEGQHIKGSPFGVIVKLPVEKLGTPILTINKVTRPWGVATNHMGEVVVTEETGHCVSVFSARGEKVRSFGTRGSRHGQFDHPRGVAVDGEGNIVVADSWNHRVQKFTSEGHFITAVGTEGSGPLHLWNPCGIAFNTSNNKVYVAEQDNHRVQVLNSDLTFSNIFGRKGCGKGQLRSPSGIACDSTGKVYVADTDNHRIQVFSARGKFLRMFLEYGQGRRLLNEHIGIVVDTSGIVYASEGGSQRISVFTAEGRFVTSFGKRGEGPGEFKLPCGLTVDNSGVVFVCDLSSGRVQVF